MSTYNRIVVLRVRQGAVVALASFVFGCGSDQSGASAVARVKARPAPGYLRVVNLGTVPATLARKDGAPLQAPIPPGAYSNLIALGAGPRPFMLNGRAMTADLAPGEGTAAILLADGKVELVPGEIRQPTSAANVNVAFAAGDASSVTGSPLVVKGEGGKFMVTRETKVLNLKPGTYQVLEESTNVEPKHSYTLLVVPVKGKYRALMMRNSQKSTAVGAGASSS